MSDVRKLMGRLNTSSAQYNQGRGGIPELTPQDIAGALGMVPDELGREVFCACWWPDGARLTRNRLLALIGLRQRAEIDRQWRAVQVVRLDLHIAEDDLAARPSASTFDIEIRDRLRNRLVQVRQHCWPAQPQMYPVIREAVLAEVSTPNHCKVCEGRAESVIGALVIKCSQCDGTGAAPVSDRQRAAMINRDESTYRREWRPVYEWTHRLVMEAEASAASALKDAIGRRAE